MGASADQLKKLGFVQTSPGVFVKIKKVSFHEAKRQAMKTKTGNPCEVRDNNLYIPFNVPSSKNSKRVVRPHKRDGSPILRKSTGKQLTMVINSDAVMRYKVAVKDYFLKLRPSFRQLTYNKARPIRLEFFFIRESKAAWDFNNISQIIQDLMKLHEWIEDDQVDLLLVYPPLKQPYYMVDKDRAGVWIKVL